MTYAFGTGLDPPSGGVSELLFFDNHEADEILHHSNSNSLVDVWFTAIATTTLLLVLEELL